MCKNCSRKSNQKCEESKKKDCGCCQQTIPSPNPCDILNGCGNNNIQPSCFLNHEITAVDCNAPYRIFNGSISQLNVEPSCCILNDPTYRDLFNTLYNAILNNNLETLLNAITNATTYNTFKALFFGPLAIINPALYSVVVTDPDGHVVIDTTKADANNTFTNYVAGTINTENFNTRVDVMEAQMFPEGTGFETAYTFINNTKTFQSSVSIRLGKWRNSAGTIRITKAIASLPGGPGFGAPAFTFGRPRP